MLNVINVQRQLYLCVQAWALICACVHEIVAGVGVGASACLREFNSIQLAFFSANHKCKVNVLK